VKAGLSFNMCDAHALLEQKAPSPAIMEGIVERSNRMGEMQAQS
jgi:hypothetical protein